MCVVDFDTDTTVWSESEHTARRREHVCDCCDGAIRKGERYVALFMVCEGDASNEKWCAACVALRDRFKAAHHGRYSNPSGMRDLLINCVDEEQRYDEDSDEYVPNETGAVWQTELDAMRSRRDARVAVEAKP